MPSYRWYPVPPTEEVNQQLRTLSPPERKLLFKKLIELYSAENPYRAASAKQLSEKRFEGSYRIRQGKYRLIFRLEVGKFVHQKHTYKGKLIIEAIELRRDVYD